MKTDTNDVAFSAHAAKRMCQRGLSRADVAYVLKHGQKRHAADAKIYFLRDKDLPPGDCRRCERLRGTAVVLSPNQPIVITVWRNRQHGLRHIKRKPTSGWQAWPTEEPSLDEERSRSNGADDGH